MAVGRHFITFLPLGCLFCAELEMRIERLLIGVVALLALPTAREAWACECESGPPCQNAFQLMRCSRAQSGASLLFPTMGHRLHRAPCESRVPSA
jgi:hypothetical protein